MFIKSGHGDLKTALDIADKTEKFYEQHKNKNSIAKSRYLSANKCFFELFDMINKEQTKMITGKLVDAAGKPREPFITGYATMNEAYLALQESWPTKRLSVSNALVLADQLGCRLILQESK